MAQAQLLDGAALACQVRQQVRRQVTKMQAAVGRPPGLAVILVGDDPASQIYVRNKEKACTQVGILSLSRRFPANVSRSELFEAIQRFNDDPRVDGILVQLPLPQPEWEMDAITNIDPVKDVDGFHPLNAGRLLAGVPGFLSCTPAGILYLLRHAGVELVGRRAVVVGRSNIVGKPTALLLLREHATVTVAHSRTRDLAAICREAEVMVVAAGHAHLIGADAIRPGAAVVDVGMNRTPAGLVGDVDFAAALQVARWITPVPGGVGPMTIAMLLLNTLLAARWHTGLDAELRSPLEFLAERGREDGDSRPPC